MPPKTFVKLWFTRAESLRCSGVMSRRHFGKTCVKYPRLSMSHVTGETLFRFVGCFVSRWISAKSMHGFKRCQSWSNFLRESKDLGFGPPRHIGFQAKARQTLLILSERRLDCKTSTFRSVSALRIQVLVPSLWRHQKHRHNLRLSGQKSQELSAYHVLTPLPACQPCNHVWIFDPECLDHEKLHKAF